VIYEGEPLGLPFFAAICDRRRRMSISDAAEFYAKGVEALENDQVHLARACFEKANEFYRCPASCSYLALCLAKARGQFREAIALGTEAVEKEPDNPMHYLHLGKVYVLSGNRRKGIEVLRDGLRHGTNTAIIQELELLGSRKPPLFPRLGRSHPLNRYLGMVLSKLRLR
jgi:tetratricopeptide (TPR) repeat protein